MHIFHEIHCDDFVLAKKRDRRAYEASLHVLERLVGVAEARGLRLALRFRYAFPEAALEFEGADNPLVRWEERGHEIGVHAHMRRIRRSYDALSAAGVRDLRCVVPGFIQSTRGECARRMESCRNMGFAWVTDQVQDRTFPYGGLTPWRPAVDFSGPGNGPLVFIEPSVNPFVWGLLELDVSGVRQRYGLRAEHFERLLECADSHLGLPAPHPITYFSYVFHEHQHVKGPDTLELDEESVEAWDVFLDHVAERPFEPCLPRDLYVDWVALEGEVPESPPGPLETAMRSLDPHDFRHDLSGGVRARIPEVAAIPGMHQVYGNVRRMRERWATRRYQALGRALLKIEGAELRQVALGARRVSIARIGNPDATAAIVVCVAGTFGGLADTTHFSGFTPKELADRGWVVWLFDRSGTGPDATRVDLSPGNPVHVEDATAVFGVAASEGLPTGWLTWSAGLIPVLAAMRRTRPAFLVDGEAPSDRYSLRPPVEGGWLLGRAVLEQDHLSDLDEAAWAGQEPHQLMASLRCPYHRLQGSPDHRHGDCVLHAGVLLNAAPTPAYLNGRPWQGSLTPFAGPLSAHGTDVLACLDSIREGLETP